MPKSRTNLNPDPEHNSPYLLDDGQIKLLSKFFFTDKGALLEQNARSEVFNQMWVMADSSSFLANNDALIAYNKDSRDIGKETNAPTQITVEKVDVNIDGGKMIGNVNNTVRDFIPPTV